VSTSQETQTKFFDDLDQDIDPGAIKSLITVFQTVCHSIEAHRRDDPMAKVVTVNVLDAVKRVGAIGTGFAIGQCLPCATPSVLKRLPWYNNIRTQ
jgi:hypothetical protein